MDAKKLKVAFVYDFDGTLSPGNMQEYDFIPAVGGDTKTFWQKSDSMAREEDADPILTYMWMMINEGEKSDFHLTRESFRQSGSKVQFFAGVESWFRRINKYADKHGILAEHYINSSGIKEMIEGTSIAKYFKKIYACSFLYDQYGKVCWPALSVNYTNKTQFLFKINKGIETVYDNKQINAFVPEEDRPIPFSRMIYFGDGTTDIPCMRLVKEKGGHSIAVYNPEAGSDVSSIRKLVRDKRVDFVCPADYSQGSQIDTLVKQVILKIEADFRLGELRSAESDQ